MDAQLMACDALRQHAVDCIAKSDDNFVKQAIASVCSTCQLMVALPSNIKEFGTTKLAPVLKGCNNWLIAELQHRCWDLARVRELGLVADHSQSETLTSASQNIKRHMPSKADLKAALQDHVAYPTVG